MTARSPLPRSDGFTAPVAVAVDVAPLHGHRTGVGVATEHLVRELGRRDDVTVLPYLVSFRARPTPPERRLPLPAGIATRMWARSWRPSMDRWLRDAHVVHGTNYVTPPTSIPTVVSVYDCWFLANPDRVTPYVARAAAVLRRAVRHGALVHVSSEATARVARQLLHTDRVHVVHLGPPDPMPTPTGGTDGPRSAGSGPASPTWPVDRPPPSWPSDRPVIAFVGTIEYRKDVPGLVRAFALLAAREPDPVLVIAGAAGNDAATLDATLAGLSDAVRTRVTVLGPIDETTKARLVADAHVLAYPSRDEGFGFPILEAQRAGTAVVGRDAGSIPEVGGDGVLLAAPGSDEDLADALGRVLTDDALRDRLVRAGTANLERFSWRATAEGLVHLYHVALERSGGTR